jgi:hypothetical protein
MSCGAPTDGDRRTCSAGCEAAARETQDKTPFIGAGFRRLRELRAAGVEPVGAAAWATMAARQRERQREENAWNVTHPERPGPDEFLRAVLPAIRTLSLNELSRRTGLSVAYLARVRRGEEVPHPRWWEPLAARPR